MRKKKDFWDIADEVVKASHMDSTEDIRTIEIKPVDWTITGNTTSSSVNYFLVTELHRLYYGLS